VEAVSERAHAKVNLTLEVIGKRSDGYHELISVMQTIDLHDTVEVSRSTVLELARDAGIPAAENLVLAAAEALRRAANFSGGARIALTKCIPAAAGLGGGSADAAATLRALNRLWGLGVSRAELAAIGAAVGSDVPFLVHEGTALVEGRGERVTPLPTPAVDSIVILAPPIELGRKTATLFARLDDRAFSSGETSRKLARRIEESGAGTADALARAALFNVFDAFATDAFPGWSPFREAFEELGASVLLSGAGPSLFALPASREQGEAWHRELSRRGFRAFHARFHAPAAREG
jgi:4-diphosphocytidyl-2-C-methyl-D-erythritol kinase